VIVVGVLLAGTFFKSTFYHVCPNPGVATPGDGAGPWSVISWLHHGRPKKIVFITLRFPNNNGFRYMVGQKRSVTKNDP
jgi:hypothetical protein